MLPFLARAIQPEHAMLLSELVIGTISACPTGERSASSMPAALMIPLPFTSRMNSNIKLPILSFFSTMSEIPSGTEKYGLNELLSHSTWNKTPEPAAKLIGIIIRPPRETIAPDQTDLVPSRLQPAFRSHAATHEPFLEVLGLVPVGHDRAFEVPHAEAQRLMSILPREVPNQARMEMIRISRDREAQHEVAQLLVKSTTAICAAIGAQPIPLADLPILTSLQVMMISGIMYVSGRERSLRAAANLSAHSARMSAQRCFCVKARARS